KDARPGRGLHRLRSFRAEAFATEGFCHPLQRTFIPRATGLEPAIARYDVRIEGTRPGSDKHLLRLGYPFGVVRCLLVRRGSLGIAIDLVEDEAAGVVLLL